MNTKQIMTGIDLAAGTKNNGGANVIRSKKFIARLKYDR